MPGRPNRAVLGVGVLPTPREVRLRLWFAIDVNPAGRHLQPLPGPGYDPFDQVVGGSRDVPRRAAEHDNVAVMHCVSVVGELAYHDPVVRYERRLHPVGMENAWTTKVLTSREATTATTRRINHSAIT